MTLACVCRSWALVVFDEWFDEVWEEEEMEGPGMAQCGVFRLLSLHPTD